MHLIIYKMESLVTSKAFVKWFKKTYRVKTVKMQGKCFGTESTISNTTRQASSTIFIALYLQERNAYLSFLKISGSMNKDHIHAFILKMLHEKE